MTAPATAKEAPVDKMTMRRGILYVRIIVNISQQLTNQPNQLPILATRVKVIVKPIKQIILVVKILIAIAIQPIALLTIAEIVNKPILGLITNKPKVTNSHVIGITESIILRQITLNKVHQKMAIGIFGKLRKVLLQVVQQKVILKDHILKIFGVQI